MFKAVRFVKRLCVVAPLGAAILLWSCKRPSLPSAGPPQNAAQPAVEPEAPKPAAPEPVQPVKHADTSGSVIVLCYHRFEEKPKDALGITPAAFESQLNAIKEGGYSVIGMSEFLAWRRGEASIPAKSCVITIDDGFRSSHDVAWPILKKFGYPFTMFIYTAYVKGGALAGGASLSWNELKQMRDEGVDIQSHTINHQSLRAKSGKFQSQFASYEEWLRNEMLGSKRLLESNLGISVKVLAYPYGEHNQLIRNIAMEAGYEAAFTVYGQKLTFQSPADQLGRYAIESTKPKIFSDALAMIGGSGDPAPQAAPAELMHAAAASMVTMPFEGEVVKELKPVVKADLAVLGEVEPGTVEIRISGVGPIPVRYDAATKKAEGVLVEPLKSRNVTVILSALVHSKKVEIKWQFVCDAVPETSPKPSPAQ